MKKKTDMSTKKAEITPLKIFPVSLRTDQIDHCRYHFCETTSGAVTGVLNNAWTDDFLFFTRQKKAQTYLNIIIIFRVRRLKRRTRKTTMKEPKVSIIVLNWNGKKDTEECLNSLRKIDYNNYDTILIDNGSHDGSVPYLRRLFPEVFIIENKVNKGFAEGNNIGVRHALKNHSEYVFLLNNDTVVDPFVLKELIATAEKEPERAIVGPKIYNYYKKEILESAGYTQSITKSRTYPIGYKEKDKGQYESEKEVDFVSGCAMLVKTSSIQNNTVFDSSFFAYCEDQDLCYSIRKKGLKILYSPHAKIWHKVSASTGGYKNPISVYLFTRNRIRFVMKRGTTLQKVLFFLYFVPYYIPAYTVYSFFFRKKTCIAFYRAFLSFFFSNIKYYEYEHVTKPLRIGVNARYIQRKTTGIEKYISQTMKELLHINTAHDYLLYFCKGPLIHQFLTKKNVHTHVTRFPTQFTFLRIIWEQFMLAKELKMKNITLFHGTSFVLPLFKPCKYILTIYDLSYLYYPESYTLLSRLYYKIFLPHSIRVADRIITISQAAKKEIMKEFAIPERKIDVIYPAVDPEFKRRNKEDTQAFIKQEYSISAPFLLFVGSLIPRKNIVRIIQAFHNLQQDKCKLVIIGKKGWLYKPIFDTVRKLHLENKVIFTSYLKNEHLPFFYNAAEALVFTSLHEGFGIPILEAMASGCPVITSNCSSMPEVAGNAALLVDPKNINEITQAMKEIITNKELCRVLVKKGLTRVNIFSWKKAGKALLDAYEHT